MLQYLKDSLHDMKLSIFLGRLLEHLYDRIKTARERAGLTVNDAAKQLGVSRVQIWRMENKTETISAERLFIIAAIYGVDPYTLFKGTSSTTQSTSALYRHIGVVVALVEEEVQHLNAKPSPDLVGEAVVEILRQEAKNQTSSDAKPQPFDPSRYKGLITLLFKQAPKP